MTSNTVRTIQTRRRLHRWLSITGSLRHAVMLYRRERWHREVMQRRLRARREKRARFSPDN